MHSDGWGLIVTHTGGYSQDWAKYGVQPYSGTYTIVKTDKNVYVKSFQPVSNRPCYLIIGKIVDDSGAESVGVANCPENEGCCFFTDDMTGIVWMNTRDFTGGSIYNTQLVPIYPSVSQYHFTDVFWSFVRFGSLTGKTDLAGKKYYLGEKLAVEYTE